MKLSRVQFKQRQERLRRLAALLRTIPEKKFDMSSWGKMADDWTRKVKSKHLPPRTLCGTTCCAAGHASLDPWFRRRGFKGKWIVDVDGYFRQDDIKTIGLVLASGVDWQYACAEFFHLSEDETFAVFFEIWNGEKAYTVKSKARQIERLVERGGL